MSEKSTGASEPGRAVPVVPEPSPEVLGALLCARGLEVPPDLLAELAPAVRDMWALGDQLERDLEALNREGR